MRNKPWLVQAFVWGPATFSAPTIPLGVLGEPRELGVDKHRARPELLKM